VLLFVIYQIIYVAGQLRLETNFLHMSIALRKAFIALRFSRIFIAIEPEDEAFATEVEFGKTTVIFSPKGVRLRYSSLPGDYSLRKDVISFRNLFMTHSRARFTLEISVFLLWRMLT
jgi:hypothetical protein